MTLSDPIKEQLIAARKNQILDAAAAVFAEKGFHPTTIHDIAKTAGISDGTIYNYFENKTALLLGIFERMKASIIPETAPLPSPEMDFRTFVKEALFYPLMALQQDNFALFRIVVSEMMVNEEVRTLYYEQIMMPTLNMAKGYFQAQVDNQVIRPVDVDLSIRVVSGLIMGLIMENILNDPVLDEKWDELPGFLTDLLLDGLQWRATSESD